MDLWKSNWTYWDTLYNNGALYSHLKDGIPATLTDQIVAFAYPVIALFLVILNIVLLLRIPKAKRRMKTFVVTVGTGSILGWIWGAWMLKVDPVFPGWLNPPWSVTGLEFIMTLEDWIFYPACTALFYMFYRMVTIKGKTWTAPKLHWTIITVYIALTIWFILFSRLAGQTEAVMFAVPGIILYIFARNTIDVKRYLIFQAFVIVFEVIWDLFAVSLVHYFPHHAWASQWIYLTLDANGGFHQSNIFLDRSQHPWAWLFMNPIEITPWFAIVGGLLDYCMFAAADKIFYHEPPLKSGPDA
jgi:hypothetical protein